MYLNIMCKPTDEELVKYASVHLTSMHEWDHSVLDCSHAEGVEEPVWACDPQHIVRELDLAMCFPILEW